ncbi:unnamed protein product [Euphydryas editha]|uniref:Uncharacterized protein n=1 Tax=Euphydryas editha TaxID=104508 RepID=A0AAU9UMU7_EUPED|nr:unnamed protein product [Euphydryas editha]
MQNEIANLQQEKVPVSRGLVQVPWPPPLSVNNDNRNESWKLFVTGWSNYKAAAGITSWGAEKSEQVANLLLSAIGAPASKEFLFDLTDKEKKSEKAILAKLEHKLSKKENIIYARYLFNTRTQKEDEKFNTFLIETQ